MSYLTDHIQALLKECQLAFKKLELSSRMFSVIFTKLDVYLRGHFGTYLSSKGKRTSGSSPIQQCHGLWLTFADTGRARNRRKSPTTKLKSQSYGPTASNPPLAETAPRFTLAGTNSIGNCEKYHFLLIPFAAIVSDKTLFRAFYTQLVDAEDENLFDLYCQVLEFSDMTFPAPKEKITALKKIKQDLQTKKVRATCGCYPLTNIRTKKLMIMRN